MNYREKHGDSREYIREAHTFLEDAESAFSAFLNRAEPQTAEAKDNVIEIQCHKADLRRFIRDREALWYELTEGLPEEEEGAEAE